jgi:hypothetical protein
MRRTLVVIDDYYDDPDAVRASALSLAYPVVGRFPGRNSLNSDVDSEMRKVSQALRLPISYSARSRDVTFFRLTKGSDLGDCDIHVDLPSTWAGVCYLNPSPHDGGGTAFFRHRRSGLGRWPSSEEQEGLVASGLVPPNDDPVRETSLQHFFGEEGRDRSRWDEICHVPPLYNRAVFYDALQFHSIRSWSDYGETLESARLTRLFFFHEKVAVVGSV